MTLPTTLPFAAEWIDGIKSKTQATRWLGMLHELRQFRAYCCDINSDGIMGLAKPPVVMIEIDPNPVCLGESVDWDLSNSYAPGAPGTAVDTYCIDMGDGTTYNVASGSHTYGAIGNYTVTATITTTHVPPKSSTAICEVQVIDCTDDDEIEPPDPPFVPIPAVPPDMYIAGWLLAFDNILGCHLQTPSGAWVPRNTGVIALPDNQGGYDPWWQITQNSVELANAICYRIQDGKIYRSIDRGDNWVAEVVSDPPNYWGDTPASTFADIEWVVRTDNIYRQGEHYFLGRWQNGASNWRTFILKREGNGTATWTWSSPDHGLIGTFAFPTDAEGWLRNANAIASGSAWDGTTGRTALGSLKLVVTTHADKDYYWYYPAAAGIIVKTGDTFTMYHKNTGAAGSNNYIRIRFTDGTWITGGLGGSCPAWAQKTITITAVENGKTISYLICNSNPSGTATYNSWWDDGTLDLGNASAYGIWMDTDTATGDYLYITVWEDDELWLKKVSTTTLVVSASLSLGAATIGEVTAKTYIAFPRVKEYDPDVVYVYGRMTAPAGLAGTQHIIKSSDGGATFASVINDWGANYCGVLLAADANDKLSCIRNTGAMPQFYHGITTPTLVGTMPLIADVPPDAFTGISGAIAAGGGGLVVVSGSDGLSWHIQTGYPTGGDVRSLVYL